jgi:hypothetical protein
MLLSYSATEQVADAIRRAIRKEVDQFVSGQCWWAEPLKFYDCPGKLAGETRVTIGISSDDDLLMATDEILIIAEQLEHLSAEYGIDWQLALAGQGIGEIREGKPDSVLAKLLEGFDRCLDRKLGKGVERMARLVETHDRYRSDARRSTDGYVPRRR